ncbi:MAG: radical SAM protein [Planctomycetes bacterium]|nr:radical SAM protein [Planctomycetota bacterium]
MGKLLTVSEIFLSIQGESTRAGLPCSFVRLAGCNLRCKWCDTPYAQLASNGDEISIEDIFARIEELACKRVEVTGGEPLIQPGALELLQKFCDAGYETLLETNGSLDISAVDERVVRIVDLKCPSSGEESKNRPQNIPLLTRRDEVKFVLAGRADYEFAVRAVKEYSLIGRCGAVIFSPVRLRLEPAELAGWILADA